MGDLELARNAEAVETKEKPAGFKELKEKLTGRIKEARSKLKGMAREIRRDKSIPKEVKDNFRKRLDAAKLILRAVESSLNSNNEQLLSDEAIKQVYGEYIDKIEKHMLGLSVFMETVEKTDYATVSQQPALIADDASGEAVLDAVPLSVTKRNRAKTAKKSGNIDGGILLEDPNADKTVEITDFKNTDGGVILEGKIKNKKKKPKAPQVIIAD